MSFGGRIRLIKDEAIVLATQDYGEADKILVILTRNFGKLEVFGKNVKKLNSRRSAACNVLSWSKFAISKSNIDTIAETVNLNQFPKIRQDLKTLALALQGAEILNSIIPAGVPSPEIFDNFGKFLKKLENSTNFHQKKIALATFQVELLNSTGWLGKDFQINKFSHFTNLEKFLISKFESIFQKRLKSTEFIKIV